MASNMPGRNMSIPECVLRHKLFRERKLITVLKQLTSYCKCVAQLKTDKTRTCAVFATLHGFLCSFTNIKVILDFMTDLNVHNIY